MKKNKKHTIQQFCNWFATRRHKNISVSLETRVYNSLIWYFSVDLPWNILYKCRFMDIDLMMPLIEGHNNNHRLGKKSLNAINDLIKEFEQEKGYVIL